MSKKKRERRGGVVIPGFPGGIYYGPGGYGTGTGTAQDPDGDGDNDSGNLNSTQFGGYQAAPTGAAGQAGT